MLYISEIFVHTTTKGTPRPSKIKRKFMVMRKILSKRLNTLVAGFCLVCIGQVVPCWMLTGCKNFNATEEEETTPEASEETASTEKEETTPEASEETASTEKEETMPEEVEEIATTEKEETTPEEASEEIATTEKEETTPEEASEEIATTENVANSHISEERRIRLDESHRREKECIQQEENRRAEEERRIRLDESHRREEERIRQEGNRRAEEERRIRLDESHRREEERIQQAENRLQEELDRKIEAATKLQTRFRECKRRQGANRRAELEKKKIEILITALAFNKTPDSSTSRQNEKTVEQKRLKAAKQSVATEVKERVAESKDVEGRKERVTHSEVSRNEEQDGSEKTDSKVETVEGIIADPALTDTIKDLRIPQESENKQVPTIAPKGAMDSKPEYQTVLTPEPSTASCQALIQEPKILLDKGNCDPNSQDPRHHFSPSHTTGRDDHPDGTVAQLSGRKKGLVGLVLATTVVKWMNRPKIGRQAENRRQEEERQQKEEGIEEDKDDEQGKNKNDEQRQNKTETMGAALTFSSDRNSSTPQKNGSKQTTTTEIESHKKLKVALPRKHTFHNITNKQKVVTKGKGPEKKQKSTQSYRAQRTPGFLGGLSDTSKTTLKNNGKEERRDIGAKEHSITEADDDSFDNMEFESAKNNKDEQDTIATGLNTTDTVDPRNRLNAGNMRGFIKECLDFKASTACFTAGGLQKPVFYYDTSNSEEIVYIALAHNRDPSKLTPQDKTNKTYQTCGEQDVAETLKIVRADFEKNQDRKTAKILMPLQQIGKAHWVLLAISTQKGDGTPTRDRPAATQYDSKGNANKVRDVYNRLSGVKYVKSLLSRTRGNAMTGNENVEAAVKTTMDENIEMQYKYSGIQKILENHNCGRYTLLKLMELLDPETKIKSIADINYILAPQAGSNRGNS